jgi:hypothetical protein
VRQQERAGKIGIAMLGSILSSRFTRSSGEFAFGFEVFTAVMLSVVMCSSIGGYQRVVTSRLSACSSGYKTRNLASLKAQVSQDYNGIGIKQVPMVRFSEH